jgi:hypothetical protein
MSNLVKNGEIQQLGFWQCLADKLPIFGDKVSILYPGTLAHKLLPKGPVSEPRRHTRNEYKVECADGRESQRTLLRTPHSDEAFPDPAKDRGKV